MTRLLLSTLTFGLAIPGVAGAHETVEAHTHKDVIAPLVALLAVVAVIAWRMSVRVKDRKTRAED
jgi:hypothetical protein